MIPKYGLRSTAQYKKDYNLAIRRGYDIRLMQEIITLLVSDQTLPQKNHDHALTGKWKGYRECHITDDWLLVYKKREDILILALTRTGTL